MVTKQQYQSYESQNYNLIPIYREILADIDTPVSIYLKLANKRHSYLLESVQGGEKWGRYSVIGLPASIHIETDARQVRVYKDGDIVEQYDDKDPIDFVREYAARFKTPNVAGLPRIVGGLVGYWGYPLIAQIEKKLDQPKSQKKAALYDAPDMYLLHSDELVVFDNLSGRLFVICYVNTESSSFEQGQARVEEIISQLGQAHAYIAEKPSIDMPAIENHFPADDYKNAVERCKEYIRDGDAFQIVPSQTSSIPFELEPIQLYRALRTVNPSPYMYYVDLGDLYIVGSSPEILVRLENDEVTLRPLAGTRKRGQSPEEDLALEKDLMADQKELSEHLMLIDLGRNDVGRVSQAGSVKVDKYMQVERYSHVMHIVSNVVGKIKPGLDALDVFRATFPAGTLSGAPKIRAMEIIDELEPQQRMIYSGAVGYLGWNGNMDTAIAIRTGIIKNKRLYVQAGAGVVADSVPETEWQETISKSGALFSAAELALSNFNVRGSNNTTKGDEQ